MPTLDWLARDAAHHIAQAVPTRVLRPHAAGAEHGDARSGNPLIQGDNLDALKALLPFYRGRVKCIFIDPPYNTKSAFEHYDDILEHWRWLTMMLRWLDLALGRRQRAHAASSVATSAADRTPSFA